MRSLETVLDTHALARLHRRLLDGFHYTPLLVGNVSYPVALPSRNQNMLAPSLNLAVQLIALIDLEAPREGNGAGLAIVITVLSIDGRVDRGKQGIDGGDLRRRAGARYSLPRSAEKRLECGRHLRRPTWCSAMVMSTGPR